MGVEGHPTIIKNGVMSEAPLIERHLPADHEKCRSELIHSPSRYLSRGQ